MTLLYRDYAVDLSPPWLLQPQGQVFMRALGDVRDAITQHLKNGVQARFSSSAAPDALSAQGNDREIERGPTDTDQGYAARLKGAWDTWEFAGTPTGVLSALFDAGYTNVVLVTTRQTHTFNSSRQLVSTTLSTPRAFSPGAPFWNAFLVWFPVPFITSWQISGVPASGSAEADGVRRLVNRWKPAHAIVTGYIATVTGNFWGQPGLKWGDSGLKWGGSNVRWTP